MFSSVKTRLIFNQRRDGFDISHEIARNSRGGCSRPVRRRESRQSVGGVYRRQEAENSELPRLPDRHAERDGVQANSGRSLRHWRGLGDAPRGGFRGRQRGRLGQNVEVCPEGSMGA